MRVPKTITKKFDIRQRQGFQVVDVDLKALETSGLPFANNGLSEGDEVTFPKTPEEMFPQKQNVRPGKTGVGDPHQVLLTVYKNGKPGAIALGALYRTARDFQPSCEFTGKMRNDFANDTERIKYLAGKTIVCAARIEMETQKFTDAGERVPGEFVKAKFPVIELLDAPDKNADCFE